jgi:hypothetical protein
MMFRVTRGRANSTSGWLVGFDAVPDPIMTEAPKKTMRVCGKRGALMRGGVSMQLIDPN